MATKSLATKLSRPGYLRPFKWLLWFILISIAWVLVYAVVPPPVTFTMLADSSGITKDWTGPSDIDRNMVRAVIAAEDGKFCNHDGFDRAARSEEHTSELQSLMRNSYAVFCLKKKN